MSNREKILEQQSSELSELCKKNEINVVAMNHLIKSEKDKRLMRKRIPLQKIIEEVITQESNTHESI